MRSFDTEPETGSFRGDSSRVARSSLWAIWVVRFGAGPTTTCGRYDRNPTPNELRGGEWPSCPCSANKAGAADAGSIPAASTTNYPESLMFSDRQNGATQSRLKTARTSRAALSLGFRRCCCAFSESVRPEIIELFLAALDRSTSKGRPNLDEDSVSQWVMIPCNMHLAMRKRSESWQAQNSDTSRWVSAFA